MHQRPTHYKLLLLTTTTTMTMMTCWKIMDFTARRYASAVYAVVVCLCLSHVSIVSKWLHG